MTEPIHRIRSSAAAWTEVDDETVLLDLQRSGYVRVNRAGSLLWSMLSQGATRAELVHRLQESYDLTDTRAEADVDAFLADCEARGYLATEVPGRP